MHGTPAVPGLNVTVWQNRSLNGTALGWRAVAALFPEQHSRYRETYRLRKLSKDLSKGMRIFKKIPRMAVAQAAIPMAGRTKRQFAEPVGPVCLKRLS
jgi:hypothetical protein